LQSVHSILDQQSKRRDPTDTTPRVKVCILDTGFDGRHPFLLDTPFGKGLGRRIKGYIGFNDDGNIFEEKRAWSDWKNDPQALAGDAYVDWDGHGTHCAGIVLQVAPEADIYIARIGRGRFDDLDLSLVPLVSPYAMDAKIELG
jgi:subtilisin family serine protease